MLEIKGKYNTAIVYTDNIDENAKEQIKTICDLSFLQNVKIRIMPDVHAGVGATIGTTMIIDDVVIPNLVGVDIGCGMEVVKLREKEIDLQQLDEVIRKYIPSGFEVHSGRVVHFPGLQDLYCYRDLQDSRRIERSLGTLGGGNHFIEVDKDDCGFLYIVIHSGSRNLGKQVANYYQDLAYENLKGKDEILAKKEQLIADYKAQGRKQEIQEAIKELYANYVPKEISLPKDLAYLKGKYFSMYMHDLQICQDFAMLNRKTMMNIILEKMTLTKEEEFTTIHNYIEINKEYYILRKGAVSAKKDEKLIIPINMRDGSLICKGLGNPDWNFSAPHGAGRIMSRNEAKENISLEAYKETMQGIYSSSVNIDTIDEAPFAYKPMDEILRNIKDTVEVEKIIRPIYNFKASE